MSGNSRDTVVVVPEGDLRFVVKNGSEKVKTFVVSAYVLRLASPVWSRMLDPSGNFMESNKGEVQFLDDAAEALDMLFRIAHLQFKYVPSPLRYEGLFNLAVQCDKYDTVGLIHPWIPGWQAHLKQAARKSDYEGYEGLLFIAWTSGDENLFRSISRKLVFSSRIEEGDLVNPGSVRIAYALPPGSSDSIIEARQKTISILLDMCYKVVDDYESAFSTDKYLCKMPSDQAACDAIAYGCLVKGLTKLKLWPQCVSTSSMLKSADALIVEILGINYYAACGGYSSLSHGPCGFKDDFHKQITKLENAEEPSGVLDSHLKHMEEQKAK